VHVTQWRHSGEKNRGDAREASCPAAARALRTRAADFRSVYWLCVPDAKPRRATTAKLRLQQGEFILRANTRRRAPRPDLLAIQIDYIHGPGAQMFLSRYLPFWRFRPAKLKFMLPLGPRNGAPHRASFVVSTCHDFRFCRSH